MIHRIFATAVSLYVFILALLALLNIALVDPPTWVALPNIFTALWFLPLILLIPLAFFINSIQLRIATLSFYALFVLLFGSWLLPRGIPDVAPEASTLRIVTLNQLARNDDTERILGAILAHDPDVIAVQELSPDVAEALSTLEDYPHQVLNAYETLGREPSIGLGVVSRYPLEAEAYDPQTRVQEVSLSLEGQSVTFINVHPPTPFGNDLPEEVFLSTVRSYDASVRNDNLAGILEQADEAQQPVVILGDFNLSDFEAAYRDFSAFENVYREAEGGFGFTFPANRDLPPFPFIRIDHIWVSEDMTPLDAGVDCQETGSDHCLLWGEVALP